MLKNKIFKNFFVTNFRYILTDFIDLYNFHKDNKIDII